ncbi:MAG: DUF4340 domain-containing protein [Candidatus Limivicinus sp.]|jgi:hypothetical protein
MKKLQRIIIAELLVIAILAVSFAALMAGSPGAAAKEHSFSDHAATDITELVIENEKGELRVASKDGGYVVEGVPAELIDIDYFIDFLVNCSEISSIKRVESSGLNLDKYGFDKPLARLDVKFSDGDEIRLSLGAQETVSGNYYIKADSENSVYLIDKAVAESYLIAKEELISFYITPELQVSSPLSAVRSVTFTGGRLEHPVTIESVADGDEEVKELARSFGAPTHIVRETGVYELDQSYGIEMLTPLCGMKGLSIIKYGLSPRQEDELGFAEPWMKVEFDYKNSDKGTEHYVLRFLPAAKDGSVFYANAAGSGTVFLIEPQPFFDISYPKLLLRWFISPLMMDVDGISIMAEGRSYEFAIDHSDPKNPVASLNGSEVDIELFRKLFQLLGTAASDGNYMGPQPEAESAPVMEICYHYNDDKPDDVLAIYPGSSRRVNVYSNGVCEFAMKESFVARVTDAVKAVAEGSDFDINW